MRDTNLINPAASVEDKVRYLLDRAELEQLVANVRGFDTDEWEVYASAFDETVRMDVAEGDVWEGKISDFVDMIRPMFDAQDASQHLVIPHAIEIDGDAARMRAYVRGYERRATASGGQEHRISAVYHFEAARRPAGWKITAMTKKVMWHDGNMGVLGD